MTGYEQPGDLEEFSELINKERQRLNKLRYDEDTLSSKWREMQEDGWLPEELCEYEDNWCTNAVFLYRDEALKYYRARHYAYGTLGKSCRIYGVPCYGEMATILADHVTPTDIKTRLKETAEFRESCKSL